MAGSDWREGSFPRRRPSDESLAWVAKSVSPGGRVVGYRRMTGGVSSAVHRVTVQHAGKRTVMVLRQYPPAAGLQDALQKELANLSVVVGSGLPVPRVVAADVDGTATGGAPSLLMTRLPGHIELDPVDPEQWLNSIAKLAVLVHSADLPARTLRPWADSWIATPDALRVPERARNPAVWRAAIDAIAAPSPPVDQPVFLHGDFLPVNMLWSRGKITGLVDWNGVHHGARAVDVGHCRRYLAALYSLDWAQRLASLYESIAGAALDPWWDLYALLHHDDNQAQWIRRQVSGRRAIDTAGVTSRIEELLEASLRRLG